MSDSLIKCNGSLGGCPLTEHCGRHDPGHDKQNYVPFICKPDAVDCVGYIGDNNVVTPSRAWLE